MTPQIQQVLKCFGNLLRIAYQKHSVESGLRFTERHRVHFTLNHDSRVFAAKDVD